MTSGALFGQSSNCYFSYHQILIGGRRSGPKSVKHTLWRWKIKYMYYSYIYRKVVLRGARLLYGYRYKPLVKAIIFDFSSSDMLAFNALVSESWLSSSLREVSQIVSGLGSATDWTLCFLALDWFLHSSNGVDSGWLCNSKSAKSWVSGAWLMIRNTWDKRNKATTLFTWFFFSWK